MGRTQVGNSEDGSPLYRWSRASRACLAAATLAVALAPACGSADSGSLYGDPGGSGGLSPADSGTGDSSAGTGGAGTTGGRPGTGGVPPRTGGRTGAGGVVTGGVASTGGVATGGVATGGVATTGGSPADSGSGCEAPSTDGHTALCVHFVSERVRATRDPELDKMGSFVLQVFDGPLADSAKKLAEEVRGASGPEISLDELAMVRVEDALPETVYVRAVFVDNPGALVKNGPGYGTWIGGADLSTGVVDPQPLLPVSLVTGKAQDIDLALVALRRLTVSLKLDTTPMGDGEGPVLVTAVRTQTPASGTPYFGIAGAACAEGLPVSLTGFVIGSGSFYLGALLNDIGTAGPLPPGALYSADSSGPAGALLAKLSVNPQDYSAAAEVPLNAVIPFPSDPVIPPNSCSDLGL